VSSSDPALHPDRGGRAGSDRAVRVLQGVTYGLGAVLVALSLWVVIARLRYPIDAEWMTGAIRDGVERVRDGKPLYVAPSARFIPFVYPPLYFWLAGSLAKLGSSFMACKVVSLGATIAAGWSIWRISRALGATARWSRMALLLHVATYSLTLLFYDLERVDGLYAGMLLVAVALLVDGQTARSTAIAGILLGLAFFAKQAGLVAFVATVVGLLLAGERRRASIVFGAGAPAFGIVFGVLEFGTGGWFRYYCLTLPSAHGIRAQRLTTFFIQDAPRAFALTAASVALVTWVVVVLIRERRRSRGDRKPCPLPWREVVLASLVAASMAAAFFFRAHSGGWPNVLVAWLPLACPAFALVATRVETAARGTRSEHTVPLLLLGAVSLQLLGAMFDPMELAPNAADLEDHERLVALVRDLEREGDVLLLPTGHITKETSAHAAALYDVLRAGDHAPTDLLEGLKNKRFAAIIVDVPVDCDFAQCDELEVAIAASYFVSARRHERDHTGTTGYDARPRWTLRPRRIPPNRTEPLTKAQLFLRQRIEKTLAEMKAAQTPADIEPHPSAEIELLADHEIRNAPPH
jgi:hypothetical protein